MARRTDTFFSEIFTDQTIEQTFMRLLKFEGGLFTKKVTECVAIQWVEGYLFLRDGIEGLEKSTRVNLDKNY